MNTLVQPERNTKIEAFLAAAGWGDAERQALGEDASTRRYERVKMGEQIAILMDAPPSSEAAPCPPDADEYQRILGGWNARTRLAACRVDAFVAIARHLKGLGLSAPEVFAFDVENGFALLEDLGDDLYANVIPKGQNEQTLYETAIDALITIHQAKTPETLNADDWHWPIQNYDRLAITTGADLFSKWYPHYDERVQISGEASRALDEISYRLAEHLAELPSVLMMRDYHAENLLWLPERDGNAKVGILDFQDAVFGPAAWDLAMFVQDARRDVSVEVQEAVIKRYADAMDLEFDNFVSDLAKAGALNALRILGVFARLVTRDGKPKYEAFMEREWGHLEDCLSHPDLDNLRSIIAKAAPFREALQ